MLRWESMLRLAQSGIPPGKLAEARLTLQSLLAELQADRSSIARSYQAQAQRLLEQLETLEQAGSEPAAGGDS